MALYRRGMKGFQQAVAAPIVLGRELAIRARPDQILCALLFGLREKFEDIRFPIRYRHHRNTRGTVGYRVTLTLQPLGAFLLLDRGALRPHARVRRRSIFS